MCVLFHPSRLWEMTCEKTLQLPRFPGGIHMAQFQAESADLLDSTTRGIGAPGQCAREPVYSQNNVRVVEIGLFCHANQVAKTLSPRPSGASAA